MSLVVRVLHAIRRLCGRMGQRSNELVDAWPALSASGDYLAVGVPLDAIRLAHELPRVLQCQSLPATRSLRGEVAPQWLFGEQNLTITGVPRLLPRFGLGHLLVHSIHQSERYKCHSHHDIAHPIKMSQRAIRPLNDEPAGQ